jgi:tetratricopeptide (TPR) repeat protein
MFELKLLAPDRIPAALEKAERYRLLNEPADAESICRDVLQIDPEHQQALVTLLLALTDQFPHERAGQFQEVCDIASRLRDEYQRHYYLGIVHERRGKARYRLGRPGCGATAYESFIKAMECYERAIEQRSPDNDEALLRYNTCARILNNHPEIKPWEDARGPLELE